MSFTDAKSTDGIDSLKSIQVRFIFPVLDVLNMKRKILNVYFFILPQIIQQIRIIKTSRYPASHAGVAKRI